MASTKPVVQEYVQGTEKPLPLAKGYRVAPISLCRKRTRVLIANTSRWRFTRLTVGGFSLILSLSMRLKMPLASHPCYDPPIPRANEGIMAEFSE